MNKLIPDKIIIIFLSDVISMFDKSKYCLYLVKAGLR